MKGYKLKQWPDSNVAAARRIVSPRRGPISSVPLLPAATALQLGDRLFQLAKLPEYVGLVTAEMAWRPVPHVFKLSETRELTQLFSKWCPLILRTLMPELIAPLQTYNKDSRLGYPYFDKPYDRMGVLLPAFDKFMKGDFSLIEGGFIVPGLRIQDEATTKKREVLRINDGMLEAVTVDKSHRAIEAFGLKRFTGRVRPVMNMPVANLFKQVLDTAIHNALLKHKSFHHDMFTPRVTPVRGAHVTFDIKHFERHTAAAVAFRAQQLGGLYAQIGAMFHNMPFLVPDSNWKQFWLATPDFEDGYSVQFSSGDSAVAPVQKEIMISIYAEFFASTLGVSASEAIRLAMDGGTPELTIRNYGDDNSISGKESVLMAFVDHVAKYLTVEVEHPQKFLGLEWRPPDNWFLPVSSYLRKTYYNERRPFSNFRKFPFLGWVEKRNIYAKMGHPDLVTKIFPAEDEELKKLGLPYSRIQELASQERIVAALNPGANNLKIIMGKEYQLTEQEKLESKMFLGIQPEVTVGYLRRLIGPELLKFASPRLQHT